MERAGTAAAGIAASLIAGTRGRVLVLAGPGNNGGDAFVVARLLRAAQHEVCVLFPGDASRLPADARSMYDTWQAAGGNLVSVWPSATNFDLIVDGLFGIGLARAPGEPYAALIRQANESTVPILALDIASGLNADTGVAFDPVIRAQHTVTFIGLKPGLLTGDGVDASGAISVHALQLDAPALLPPAGYRLDWTALRERRPKRKHNVHKGSHGALAIIGGASGMTGAILLAGRAALQAGAGKVLLGLVGDDAPTVDYLQPELMLRAAHSIAFDALTALAIGPGLGRSARARDALLHALASVLPLVLDADALNQIAEDESLAHTLAQRSAAALITPHPAEAARLLHTNTREVQRDRIAAALALATQLRCGVVVKGAGSVCAFPDGRWFINGSGNAGLASAGTGDVLTGLIAALLAQGLPSEDALLLGVCLHGAAADRLLDNGVGPIGMVASELPRAARELLNGA